MYEDETKIGHEAAQSRIGMVIPASLDASGVVSEAVTQDDPGEITSIDAEPATVTVEHDTEPAKPEPTPEDNEVQLWIDTLASMDDLKTVKESSPPITWTAANQKRYADAKASRIVALTPRGERSNR
jgi:hypothetical protein